MGVKVINSRCHSQSGMVIMLFPWRVEWDGVGGTACLEASLNELVHWLRAGLVHEQIAYSFIVSQMNERFTDEAELLLAFCSLTVCPSQCRRSSVWPKTHTHKSSMPNQAQA